MAASLSNASARAIELLAKSTVTIITATTSVTIAATGPTGAGRNGQNGWFQFAL